MTAQVEAFTQHRSLLFAVAYRMIGMVADAEDLVQETFLRWQRALAEGEVIAAPKSWLTAVITRLCIDHLRSARVRREEYVGPWLPEPLLTDTSGDPAESTALTESLTLAFLVVLESLTPVERAIFLLHDIFAYDFAEIARIVDKSEANCRQLARRARAHIAERRPRHTSSPEERERLVGRFIAACQGGDLPGLIATLADDIVLRADGGGKALAARRPLHGASDVARFVLGILKKAPEGMTLDFAMVNHEPAFIALDHGRPYSVVTLDIADGRVRSIAIVANPDKLGHLARVG
ncbi:MAG: RNA polymerase sigma-70 factor [Thermomicrobiales bacterium]